MDQDKNGTEVGLGPGQVGLGPGHIVLDGDPAPPSQRGTAPSFRPVSIVAKWSPISATAEHLFKITVIQKVCNFTVHLRS